MRYVTHSPEETCALAARLADRLSAGSILCLNGEMGSGKTSFTNGIMKRLDCESGACSPTFDICHSYKGKFEVLHFDLYRIHDEDDLYSTGFFDLLDSGACCIIEWSAAADAFMPDNAVYIDFEYGPGENDRIITVRNGEI